MISESDIFTALVAFVGDICPALAANPANIRQGQQNAVPMPPGPSFCLLTPADRAGLSTTIRDYFPSADPAPAQGARATRRSTQIGIAVDFYGGDAADNGQIFNTLFRDLYGADFFAGYAIAPLWCDDGRQMPLIDSEKQYETRWMIRAVLQANPEISTPQDFADIIEATLIEANAL
jgi:hypothetical protein